MCSGIRYNRIDNRIGMPKNELADQNKGGAAVEFLQALLQQVQNVKLTDILDIAIVAILIYKLLPVLRSTGTVRIAWVVAAVVVVSWLTELLQLHTLHYILSQLLAVGLLAVVVLFQPELRRMLDHVSNIKLKSFLGIRKPEQEMLPVIMQTVRACEIMGKEKVGALIVFSRENSLDEYFKSGTMIEAQVSEQLIRTIFFPKAALHDGAMIVRNGRVAAAGCVLPLSDNTQISSDLGTRHRAALGISEVTDSVTVVVSEETGTISVAVGGVLKRHLAPEMLERLLRNELCPEDNQVEENVIEKLRQKLQKKDKGGDENEE